MNNHYEEWVIPTYIINLQERKERRKHIEQQFVDKPEFEVNFVEAVKHQKGNIGLWKSLCNVIHTAMERNEDIICVCEDDHFFTPYYHREILFSNIIEANQQGADFLSCGIAGFGNVVPVGNNRYWVDSLLSTQMIIIFEPLFQRILEYDFQDDDAEDLVISKLSNAKQVIFPFISIQKDFGYSDVTEIHNQHQGIVQKMFQQSFARLSMIHHIYHKYKN